MPVITIYRIMISLFLILGLVPFSAGKTEIDFVNNHFSIYYSKTDKELIPGENELLLNRIASSILSLSQKKDTSGLQLLAVKLIESLPDYGQDSLLIADLYYYSGVCESMAGKQDEALRWLKLSVEMKEKLRIYDNRYAKGIYNVGVIFMTKGDIEKVYNYLNKYIVLGTELYGENSSEVAGAYSTLVGASLEGKDFEKFLVYTFKALGILGKNKAALNETELIYLYHSIGAGYSTLGDYTKARIYLEEAEALLNKTTFTPDESYINLINTLAITYGFLGLNEKEGEYFNKGIELAVLNNSYLAFNLINSYVISLGNSGKIQKGEALLTGLIEKARSVYGVDSRYYVEVLRNYAEFLLNYEKDYPVALSLYSECIEYLNRHREDFGLRDQILIGFAEALYKNGESLKARQTIQDILFRRKIPEGSSGFYNNPDPDSLLAVRSTLRLLHLKYEILWDLYSHSSDQKALEAAAGTSEIMISLIDKIRINISEDESRIVLGDRYRESYLLAIRDFELCYRNTGNQLFLEKTFRFIEKSKVAGLLAATRELNAIQFHIPKSIADFEKSIQQEIGFYNSKISAENNKVNPDIIMLADWKEKLLSAVKVRDSLVMTFERDYPGYYSIKYMTGAPTMKEIPSIIGRDINYLNYVISDSLLYICLVNRKYQKILAFKIDSMFHNELRNFRVLLSDPSVSQNARKKFNEYQDISYELFETLINPVSKYFISKNLLISPDNMLSYLPFETLLSSKYSGNNITYRDLNYLMNDYSISYTYSATFIKEMVNREYGKMRNLIAFAPFYPNAINIDSLFLKRQVNGGMLYDLPFARQEAEYVADITGGNLYLNDEAKESLFKKNAGNYDIIHLAMHTYLNDENPMNSAMIFSQGNDSTEDGLLCTYEVYGIPLKARMVVLSSCNTGNGVLTSGEGILSLARGFLYSGSQSVIMSMWEIEDKSGTDITKKFYDYLKQGKSKSGALKKARYEYLKKAVQLRSHPYFWSALVIYGDNSPVYPSGKLLIGGLSIFALIVISLIFYFRKRKYS